MKLNKVYNEDCIIGLKKMKSKCVDLVVTSPPYDSLRTYKGSLKWSFKKFKKVAKELYRVVKKGGVVVWNVNDQTIDGSKTGSSFRQCLYFMNIGFNLNDTMIWKKTNPMPQVKQPRYTSCFEYMFVFSKGKPKTFNPIMRTTVSSGKVYDSTVKNIGGENGRVHKKFIVASKSPDYNVWNIGVAQNKDTNHPAVFPIAIPKKHIRSWTNKGDVVLDPFIGSGTTAIACIKLNRKFIGFEINKDYYKECKRRVKKYLEEDRWCIFK